LTFFFCTAEHQGEGRGKTKERGREMVAPGIIVGRGVFLLLMSTHRGKENSFEYRKGVLND
jgi:hypothetical protein